MTPQVLKILIGLAVCVIVAVIVIAVMASKKSDDSKSKSESDSKSDSESESETNSTSYNELPSPSISGEVPASSSSESSSSSDSSSEEVPSPSNSTISFGGEESSTPVTSTPEIPAVPKTYYLRLVDAYGAKGNENVEVKYFNKIVTTLRMGKGIVNKKTHDILLSKDAVPLITDVTFYLKSGSADAFLPFIYIVEKEGSTDTTISENFAPILYNNKKKYVTALKWTKETYYFKPK